MENCFCRDIYVATLNVDRVSWFSDQNNYLPDSLIMKIIIIFVEQASFLVCSCRSSYYRISYGLSQLGPILYDLIGLIKGSC